ncbi:adenine-specific methyltransferase EcoRI family protein [Lutimonas zeaxanthinifaciens]|uniref:adenine-specific methyltransferase EcoRI family protein n=1 Tax=Lutimonas zeaxanthinifaciens TaxID=3060215 RepID=UPI00265D38FB|nr:adenine-specific methyltransferase EcoRI family protein [Lutimonas sp. YSD2104]WKK67512.1 adenine-specific methyltransferase EcoRI family protein [Lutimonas sp. YSD2104]
MANKSLGTAKKAKNDEYYTQLADIEKELRHYVDKLRGKVIFCNCDDPYESNFFKYFAMNFNHLGIKKLIATSYDPSPIAGSHLSLSDVEPPLKKGLDKDTKHAYKVEITEVRDYDGDGSIDLSDVEYLLKHDGNSLKLLEKNGDFRSKESIELLNQADVVITNPPFSMLREYIAQLIEYEKEFIIIGSLHSLHYKEIFDLIKTNKLWLGYKPTGTDMLFNVPEDFARELVTTKKEGSGYKIINGIVMGRAAVIWYTNLDIKKRHDILDFYKKYTPEEYPKYDNLDAIEVGKVVEIPEDYYGLMGVPDSFLDKFNPDQFELIGLPTGNSGKEIGVTKNYRGRTDISLTRDGQTKCPYSRIIIKRKQNI